MTRAKPNALLVGWSSTSITPPKPVMLAGQFYVRVSKRVADPITATVLALSAGSEQAVFVSCDLLGIGPEILARVREKAAPGAPGLDVRRILMNATHIHTGPVYSEGWYQSQGQKAMAPGEYVELLTDRVASAIAEAWNTRKPGNVSRAFGHAVVGHNRRAWYADGHAEMYGKSDRADFHGLEGCEDHSVDMLFVWNSRRSLSGVVVNVACPSQVSEHDLAVTADYWHETRVAIRRRLGRKVFVMPQCAAAGDQSPHLLVYGAQEQEMRERRGTSEREEIGRKIAQAVAEAYPVARKAVEKNPVLRHAVEDLQLTPRQITEREVAKARSELTSLDATPEAERPKEHHALAGRARSVIERYEKRDSQKPFGMELHVVRVGGAAFVTNPFELYLDYGLRMKARSKAKQTFVVQLACAYSGYLPTARAIAAGSYGAEPASNRVGPEGGQELVERTLALVTQFWP